MQALVNFRTFLFEIGASLEEIFISRRWNPVLFCERPERCEMLLKLIGAIPPIFLNRLGQICGTFRILSVNEFDQLFHILRNRDPAPSPDPKPCPTDQMGILTTHCFP